MKNLLFIFSFLFAVASSGFAQEEEIESGTHRPQIRAAILMAYSHVPNSYEGETKVVVLPTWGFDVDYFFHSKWSFALQGDVKIQSFEVEHEGIRLERNFPVAFAGVIHYHALRHWSFYFGPGYELEKSENLFLVKMGTEYSFEVSENFEIALNLAYENKDNVYDTLTFGVAFNKRIWKKE